MVKIKEKRFPTFWDNYQGKELPISSKSKTIPNMTYNVREILERAKAGKIIRGISNPLYLDTDLPRMNDLTDIDYLRKEQRIATDKSLKLKARNERLKAEEEALKNRNRIISEYEAEKLKNNSE